MALGSPGGSKNAAWAAPKGNGQGEDGEPFPTRYALILVMLLLCPAAPALLHSGQCFVLPVLFNRR